MRATIGKLASFVSFAFAFASPALPLAIAAVASIATGASSGCSDQALPGDDYGMYKVSGQSTANSCGAGLDAPNPWVFDAEISRDGTTMYWSFLDGNAPLSGPLDTATMHASITTSVSANVDASDAGLGPCTLNRSDDVELTLPATTPPASLSGTIAYTFAVPSGSTCTDQLTSGGGTYATLPCTVSYTFTAARQ
jgi:hypothetical protein